MKYDIGYAQIYFHGHGNVHFWVSWVLNEVFLGGGQGSPKAGSSPKWSGLPEYMDVTLAWQDEWEAQSQKIL